MVVGGTLGALEEEVVADRRVGGTLKERETIEEWGLGKCVWSSSVRDWSA